MSKARIMLVEDEKVVAADIQECVTGLGYHVVGAAATGAEALRMAVNTTPDLVLMDIKLKGDLDGIEVAETLYEQLEIPVVYLTAHADNEILERARRTAPSGYVLKPFDDRSLHTAIKLAFDRHRRERGLIDGGRRLAAAIGSIDEGVIVTQENGRIALMNRVAETLTGWKQEEALGKPIADVFTILNARTGAPRPSPVGRVFREGVAMGLGEDVLLLGRNGSHETIQGSATPVRNSKTNAVGVCLLFRAATQRAADEPWGTPEHMTANRLEIIGRLTAAVAQEFTRLLEAGRGRMHAVRLANRLLEFGLRQPAPPASVDLNELIAGLDDLLECALGDDLALQLNLGSDTGSAKADPGAIELMLVHLALAARDAAGCGELSIETTSVFSEDAGDACVVITVTPPEAVRDFPALDEIVRNSPGEIRVSSEDGAVKIYLPV